jgi:hypothetical protein
MRGAIPPLSQYAFMAWCLVKHRDNFTFTFTFAFMCDQVNTQSNEDVLEISVNKLQKISTGYNFKYHTGRLGSWHPRYVSPCHHGMAHPQVVNG